MGSTIWGVMGISSATEVCPSAGVQGALPTALMGRDHGMQPPSRSLSQADIRDPSYGPEHLVSMERAGRY